MPPLIFLIQSSRLVQYVAFLFFQKKSKIFVCKANHPKGLKIVFGGVRTHASEETTTSRWRLGPLGHEHYATFFLRLPILKEVEIILRIISASFSFLRSKTRLHCSFIVYDFIFHKNSIYLRHL